MSVDPALLREIETLPEEQQADVLAFVRFLKIRFISEEELERNFSSALDRARTISEERGISESDIEDEIKAARSGE